MWGELISRSQKEKRFWREIQESGQRYEGADIQFKELRLNNTGYLYAAVQRDGWPNIIKHGEELNNAAFSIARSSIQSPNKMKYFAEQIAVSVSRQESKPVHLAALRDCISYYEGKPQVCGMFLEWKVSGELYANVECLAFANIKRRELGLPTVAVAVQEHLIELEANPGSKPIDIVAHNKMHRAWAKSVGWSCE